jgi:Acetyltransferases
MKVTLREATANDLKFLYRLHRAAMEKYVVQTWGQWDEVWQAQYLSEHFDPDSCQIIVAESIDIGVISLVKRPTEIFLSGIEVLPAYQGQGIGTHLISGLMTEARGKGIPITLQVLKVNPARRLYERLGFSINGETATHYTMST